MRVAITLTEKDLRELVHYEICKRIGDFDLEPSDVVIQVKSKQNYKSEWESAEFKAVIDKEVTA